MAMKLQEKQGIPLAPPLLITTALKYSLMCFGLNRKSDDLSHSICGLHGSTYELSKHEWLPTYIHAAISQTLGYNNSV